MWGGFSYSSSHINRDMVTFHYDSTGIGVKDTFSLLGMAPYEDTSSNVEGANNIEVISSEQSVGYSVILIKRPYDTHDKNGDEVITIKLNQQFCLALYTKSPTKAISIESSPIHNYLKCITPDIGLRSSNLEVLIMLCVLYFMF